MNRSRSPEVVIIPPKIPRPVYATIKDKGLRDMLGKHRLVTTGTRDQMIRRMQRFIIHYESNRDRAHPVSELEVARQVTLMERKEEEEERRVRRANASGIRDGGTSEMGQTKTEQDEIQQHELKYHDEFAALILQVKQRSKRRKEEEGKSDDALGDKRIKHADQNP